MQTDLYLLGDNLPQISRALLAEWAGDRRFVLLREWPVPRFHDEEPVFDGTLLLMWSGAGVAARRADQAFASRGAATLLRLNYDMQIDGILFERALPWRGGGRSGIACNLQPHGGAGLVHLELARWLAPRLDAVVIDPILGAWSEDLGRFSGISGWREVFAGSLANPAHLAAQESVMG